MAELSTHCSNGHPWTEATTYRKGKNSRQCKLCWATRRTREREERKAAPTPPKLDPKAFARLVDAILDGIPERDLLLRFSINHDYFLVALRAAKHG